MNICFVLFSECVDIVDIAISMVYTFAGFA